MYGQQRRGDAPYACETTTIIVYWDFNKLFDIPHIIGVVNIIILCFTGDAQ